MLSASIECVDGWLVAAAVPGRPTMVNMTECMPDSVVITVSPPENNGGMPVTGYNVQYDGGTYHYSVGDSGVLLRPLFT